VDNKTRAFLNKILSDPMFRDQVEKDPVTALGSVGITVNSADLPKPINLPSDEEIRALLVLDKPLERLKLCESPLTVCGWPKP
jgi:hypothetical protein